MASIFTRTNGLLFLFIFSLSKAAMANYSVSTDNIPERIALDTSYVISIDYTTPDSVEELDIQLSFKDPATGYTRYFNQRRSVAGSNRGHLFFTDVLLDGSPASDGDYIWEIKFLQTGQVGEDNPLFYYTVPVKLKETGFIITDFNVPSHIEPYDSYDLEINYFIDESARANVTLVNNQTGDEVVKLTDVRLPSVNRDATQQAKIKILNDPIDGDYSWRLDVVVDRDDTSKIVHSQSTPTTLIFEDEIKSFDLVGAGIAPGATRDIRVAYTATQDRELMFELWSTQASDYRVVRKPVTRGSGTIVMPMDIPTSIDASQDYHWWTKLVPVGGQWWELIDEKGGDAVVAANLSKAPFFDYPLYSFPGRVFTFSNEHTHYTVRIDENIIAGNAAIYVNAQSVDSIHRDEFTLNLTTGDLLHNRTYSSEVQSFDIVNPYHDAGELKEYRSSIDKMISPLRTIAETDSALGDAIAHVRNIQRELTGWILSRPWLPVLYFDFIPRAYNLDFTWRSPANHPNRIKVRTDGVELEGGRHAGLTIESESTYGLIQETLTFDLETGDIKKVVDDGTANVITEESATHPYRAGGDLEAYLSLLNRVENKLRTLANGTKVGDSVLAKAYPQMGEYADNILNLIQKTTPVELFGNDLYFGGQTTVFNHKFRSVGPGNHPSVWRADFSQNSMGEWELETLASPGYYNYDRVITKINLSSGELYLFDERTANSGGITEYTVLPPDFGGDVELYRQALTLLIAHVHKVETQDLRYFRTRPQLQLKDLREYLEGVLDSL